MDLLYAVLKFFFLVVLRRQSRHYDFNNTPMRYKEFSNRTFLKKSLGLKRIFLDLNQMQLLQVILVNDRIASTTNNSEKIGIMI